MSWHELTFKHKNFYPFDDDTNVQEKIINQCHIVDVNNILGCKFGNCSIFHMNCACLRSKYDNINILLTTLSKSIDFLCFSESWICENDVGLNFDDYESFHFSRMYGKGGGIPIYGKIMLQPIEFKLNHYFPIFEYGIVKTTYFNMQLFLITGYKTPISNLIDFF